MSMQGRRRFGGLCAIALALGLAGCQVSLGQLGADAPTPEAAIDIGYGDDSLTVNELRASVAAFAARFYGTVGEAADSLLANSQAGDSRLDASRSKFYLLASAADISTSESPAIALLDMVAFVRLAHLRWEAEGIANFGEAARPLVRALGTMEHEVWLLAARVLSPEQRVELRQVIDEWRAAHPEEHSAAFVRLTEYGSLGQRTALRELRSASGLLGQVQSALGQVDQLRVTAERGLLFAKTAQAMLPTQLELIVREILSEPEMKDLFGLVSSTRVLAGKLAEQAEAFGSIPEAIRTESAALLDVAMSKVSAERNLAIVQAMEGVAKERQALLAEMFERVAEERRTVLEEVFQRMGVMRGDVTADVRSMVKEERKATLEDAFRRVTGERKDTFQDLKALIAEERGAVFEQTRTLIAAEREAALEGVGKLMDGAFVQMRSLLILAAVLAAACIVLVVALRFVKPRSRAS